MLRTIVLVLFVFGITVAAAGCGRKAAPEHPPGSDYPRAYPARR